MRTKILIVDDEPHVLAMVGMRLESLGYDITRCGNSNQALAQIEKRLPDVIILDIRMPGMDGYELCHMLKEDPRCRHIPILLFSALTEDRDKLLYKRSKADGFVDKPGSTEQLDAMIRKVLGDQGKAKSA